MLHSDYQFKKVSPKSPTVLIAAGGSGGHTIPAQVVAKALRQKGYHVHFAASGLSSNRFFGKHEFQYSDIPSLPFSFSSPWNWMSFAKSLVGGSRNGCQLLNSLHPEVVIGFGSYHTVSILSAAWLKKVPIILHEANAYPGDVIRLFSRAASFVGCYFSSAMSEISSKRSKMVDIPIREEILASPHIDKKRALDRYGFTPHIPTFLVVGGSQGAKGINKIVPDALIHLAHMMYKEGEKRAHIQVLHISGGQEEVLHLKEHYRMHKGLITATVIPYESHMEYAYRACDIAITRSGASTVAELSFLKIPAIFIPYPHAKKNHQFLNAQASLEMRESIGEIISEDSFVTKGFSRKFAETLFSLFHKKEDFSFHSIKRSSFIDEIEKIIQAQIQSKRVL